jgi:hypothetical protein
LSPYLARLFDPVEIFWRLKWLITLETKRLGTFYRETIPDLSITVQLAGSAANQKRAATAILISAAALPRTGDIIDEEKEFPHVAGGAMAFEERSGNCPDLFIQISNQNTRFCSLKDRLHFEELAGVDQFSRFSNPEQTHAGCKCIFQ